MDPFDFSRSKPFGDGYMVTENGEVWSSLRKGWQKMKPHADAKGYLRITLRKGGIHKTMRLNRVVTWAFYGPPPFEGAVSRHLNDDRTNNHKDNLRWGSASDNSLDSVRNGRCSAPGNSQKTGWKRAGSANANAKLTEQDVLGIRALLEQGIAYLHIAPRFNISKDVVGRIARGERWRHVQLQATEPRP